MTQLVYGNVDAVLPAGGRIHGEYARVAGCTVKAMIPFGGETILSRTIKALKALPQPGRVVVIGPEETLEEARACGADASLLEGNSGPENIFKGIDWLQSGEDPARKALIVTTDMPFVNASSLYELLNLCPPDADICVPLVRREPFEVVYPDLVRTDSRLADGYFRLGGAFLVDVDAMRAGRAHFESVFAARKSNLKMARLIGLQTALKYAAGKLSTTDIVNKASSILHCRGAAVHDVDPVLGFDIDLLEEYQYAIKQAF